ncbi:hypothetical protein MOSE0_N09054 [Monosporozyma servazzii]
MDSSTILSWKASNAIIWPTYGILLISATALAYWIRDSKTFLSANGTQKAFPLSFNFVASALGCGVFAAYPEVANISGLHGLLVYAITGALPMFVFAFLGPIIRKKTPNGFLLTEWVFHRYGLVCGWYVSACTILTVYLFMVSEVSSLKFCIQTMTGVTATAVVIIEAVVTTLYTSVGGFNISFLTDSLQVSIVFILLIIVSCAMGSYIDIDTSKIGPSNLLKQNKLGWQLIYILTIAIFTNDFFMSGFWLRTFAARSDRDLLIGCSIASVILFVFVTIIGVTGFIAVWAGLVEVNDANAGSSFYLLLAQLPRWVMGFTLVFILVLSTCTFDSLQSALVSTVSNDVFRNKLPIMWVRGIVVLIMVPVVVVGLIADDVLTIYMIVDLLSSSVVPVLILGLFPESNYYWTAWEVIGGGLGGILATFIFGTIYYGSAKEGGKLLLIWNGLYVNDWSTFGAFVTAPLGGLVSSGIIMVIRFGAINLYKRQGRFHDICNSIGEATYIIKLYHFIDKWEQKLVRDTIETEENFAETTESNKLDVEIVTTTSYRSSSDKKNISEIEVSVVESL